jgi:hypothetical protein
MAKTKKNAKNKKSDPKEVENVAPNAQDENVIETAAVKEAPAAFKSRSGAPKRPPRSLSTKSGLLFPVFKIRRALRRGRYANKIQTGEEQHF